ncbi:hypothetical protein MHU86_5002 [Fragilaria crotonensis]|nr:hypothetical protein MHU86_5002 [Fragilaria crotonensis]
MMMLRMLIVASCLVCIEAWNPSWGRVVQKLHQQVTAVSLVVAACSLPCHALDPSIYNKNYDDPLHPLCLRHISVDGVKRVFHYSGTDVGSKDDPIKHGCSFQEAKEFGSRRGAFDGRILDDGTISVGDGIHEGVWEPANSAVTSLGYEDVDGIRWNDGNKWTVKSKSPVTKVGEVIFYTYIGVSTLAGVKGAADKIREKVERD